MRHDLKHLSSVFELLALIVLLASCGFPGVVASSAQLPQVSQKTQPQAQLPPVRFPQDEAAHNDLTEWWYYTGHLNATEPNGQQHYYGFELVIFQALRSDLPPVYAAHFAISDITRGQFQYAQQRATEPHAIIPNGTSTAGINEHVGNWSITGLNGHDQLVASMSNYAIDLHLTSLTPPVLHNGNGLITYGLAGFSYYYSRPRMTVSGTIVDHNQPLTVTGLAWMDHQWGNFLTVAGSGWDWFSVQLNNNTEMMLYFIRDASDKTASTYIEYIDEQAQEHLIPASELHATVLAHWTSPVTHVTYPSGWRLMLNDSLIHATLTLQPQLRNQELVVYQSTGNSYWEGAVNIQGQVNGRSMQGQGYVELTGYAPNAWK